MSVPASVEHDQLQGRSWHRLVVGFDGTALSRVAVEWAANEAAARASVLRVVTCSAVPDQVDFYGVGARQGEQLVELVEDLAARHPLIEIDAATTHLDPRDALIVEAEQSDLLVVGASTAGTAKALLLGSVAKAAARRSPCPVVVVRATPARAIGRIVVAVDGSNASERAVDWACAEADVHGAELVLIHAWERPAPRHHAHDLIAATVGRCRQLTASEVHGSVIDGPAVEVLVEASRHADLVAVGSRGRSGFKTALFGSVALSIADAAECPVAVTHPKGAGMTITR